ncbi:YbhB/YbcL family Raf kinase inhibitor-like protein [Hydrogenophaga sp. 5NK40-0174]|uniref:YbhB/YbcL family Raf kinase inhibitor-like protein n=1 Tax=Hydrogenophaga sp. 5NK40-0174 TaxID=3127649 RepID=UPI003107AE9B
MSAFPSFFRAHSGKEATGFAVWPAWPSKWLVAGIFALGASMGAQAEGAFSLSSTDVQPGKMLTINQVFKGFGCEGGNVSPALAWKNAPQGTQSFALTVYDPDAPTGSGWWHWMAYNIPVAVSSLPAGAGGVDAVMPDGVVQVRNDFGVKGFGGACPPPGDKPHRYQFTIHALKVDKLELPADASAALVGYMINANKLGSASIEALYQR